MLHGSPKSKNPPFVAQQLFALREDEGEYDTSRTGSVTLEDGSGRGARGGERDTSRSISGCVPSDGLPLTVDSDGSHATVDHATPHRYSALNTSNSPPTNTNDDTQTHLTCFTRTKVRILTLFSRIGRTLMERQE